MGTVNIEVNENIELASPPPISRSRAQRISRIGRRRVVGPQISSHTPGGNLARRQLAVPRRSVKRPKLTSAERLFWTWLCDFGIDWRSAWVIVKPETVVACHRNALFGCSGLGKFVTVGRVEI